MSIHIGIDASRATREQRTGTEGYSLHMLRALLRLDTENAYTLYYNTPPTDDLIRHGPNVQRRVMPFPRLWTHARLSWQMLRRPPDVLFVPAHVLPLVHPRRCVVTIHDLGYYHEPEAHPPRQRAYLEWATRFNAEQATLVIADSAATQRDLVEILRVPPSKIRVVHLGVDERFHPLADAEHIARVRQRYGLNRPYILYVGTLQPRKNLVRLIEAFARVARAVDDGYEGMNPYAAEGGAAPLTLVLAGRKGWGYEPIRQAVRERELSDRVIFPGYVSDEDLPALYCGAELFVLPSLYEGFGLPALEAMACGVPVVVSNVSSLPEIVGDAGVLAKPTDPADLARAMIRVLMDSDAAGELRRRGVERARQFTWEECARQTQAALLEAAGM